jgi:hypothetical protein
MKTQGWLERIFFWKNWKANFLIIRSQLSLQFFNFHTYFYFSIQPGKHPLITFSCIIEHKQAAKKNENWNKFPWCVKHFQIVVFPRKLLNVCANDMKFDFDDSFFCIWLFPPLYSKKFLNSVFLFCFASNSHVAIFVTTWSQMVH